MDAYPAAAVLPEVDGQNVPLHSGAGWEVARRPSRMEGVQAELRAGAQVDAQSDFDSSGSGSGSGSAMEAWSILSLLKLVLSIVVTARAVWDRMTASCLRLIVQRSWLGQSCDGTWQRREAWSASRPL